MQEATITDNVRSYFERPLSTKQKRLHSSAEEERDWARQTMRECRECKKIMPRSHFGYNTSSSWPFDRAGRLLRRPECMMCNLKSNKTKKMVLNFAYFF